MVDKLPVIEEVLPELVEFIGMCPVVAHYVEFAKEFFDAACKKVFGKPKQFEFLDTMLITQKLEPDLRSYKLKNIAELFRFDLDDNCPQNGVIKESFYIYSLYEYLRDLHWNNKQIVTKKKARRDEDRAIREKAKELGVSVRDYKTDLEIAAIRSKKGCLFAFICLCLIPIGAFAVVKLLT